MEFVCISTYRVLSEALAVNVYPSLPNLEMLCAIIQTHTYLIMFQEPKETSLDQTKSTPSSSSIYICWQSAVAIAH